MKLWQRILMSAVSVAALYVLWRFPIAGVGTILVGAAGAWTARSIYRSKLAPNPMGEHRDYSLRQGITALIKAVGSFAAAMLWAVSAGHAAKIKYLPDTWFGAVILAAPLLLLMILGAYYLVIATTKFLFGSRPSRGSSNGA
jgi:hypothetical protein